MGFESLITKVISLSKDKSKVSNTTVIMTVLLGNCPDKSSLGMKQIEINLRFWVKQLLYFVPEGTVIVNVHFTNSFSML